MPRYRVDPEDFQVDELQLYPPTGQGPFTLLWVESTLRNTADVAAELANLADREPHEAGYAGRKDRRAVTRQWFSLPDTDPDLARTWSGEGFRVLDAVRHRDRLRPGDLEGNRFRVVVRGVTHEEGAAAEARGAELLRTGAPNQFGQQRFGREGDNAEWGARLLRGEGPRASPRRARLWLSAWQSAIFNEVLARRPAGRDELLAGDLAWRHATGALVPVADPARHSEELANFALSATGPMFGSKMRRPSGAVRRLEDEVLAAWDLPSDWERRLPRRLRLPGGRRPVRVAIPDLSLELTPGVDSEAPDLDLTLQVTLPPGAYVTVLLAELFPGGLDEASGPVD